MDIWLGLDVGYGYTKIVRGDNLLRTEMFPSISGSLSTQAGATATALSMPFTQWEIDGTERFVGHEVYRAGCRAVYRAYDANRVDNEHYKFLATVGLALLLPTSALPPRVHVVTGLPNQFFHAERERLSTALLGRHHVRERNGSQVVDHTFVVESIKVLPQSIGGLSDAYLKGDGTTNTELNDLHIGGIDIGFRTVDLAGLNPGWQIDSEALRPGGDNLGMATVAKLCESHLSAQWQVNFGIHEIDQALKDGNVRIRGEIVDIHALVTEWKRQAASQIWEYVTSQWDRLKRLDRIYFMGGGSIALFEALQETAPVGITEQRVLLPEAAGAIARGFAKASAQWKLLSQEARRA